MFRGIVPKVFYRAGWLGSRIEHLPPGRVAPSAPKIPAKDTFIPGYVQTPMVPIFRGKIVPTPRYRLIVIVSYVQ